MNRRKTASSALPVTHPVDKSELEQLSTASRAILGGCEAAADGGGSMRVSAANLRALLASSSVAALLVGAGAPPARASSCSTGNPYFFSGASVGSVSNSGNITCIQIVNSTVGGNVSNTGSINGAGSFAPTRTGITVDSSKIGGAIINQGTITSSPTALTGNGILIQNGATVVGGVTNGGTITANSSEEAIGIRDDGSTIPGGILNSAGGQISASGLEAIGIWLESAPSFAGGIVNGGAISANGACAFGIRVEGGALFGGGISNAGTITVNGNTSGTGIFVGGISTFTGGISNTGTISASGLALPVGIFVSGVDMFTDGITNGPSGVISVSAAPGGHATGIYITNVTSLAGGINNRGIITTTVDSGTSYGIYIAGVSTFSGGGVSNTGSITAGIGIYVTDSGPITVFDSGYIDGTSGVAVDLRDNLNATPNIFTLGPGWQISGTVYGATGDTFQLGGSGTGVFDLSKIGDSQQFEDFTTFNVVSGTWITSGTFGQSQTWNVNGGTLAGTGTFAGINVNNGGTLEPGMPGVAGGKLTVNGNLVFSSGANYLVNISPSASSITVVNGSATLGGVLILNATGGTYVVGTKYDILSATGGLNDTTFSTVEVTGSFGGLTPVVTYDDVFVTLVPASLDVTGFPVNQTDAGNAVSSANIASNGNLPPGFQNLFSLSQSQLLSALTQIDGEAATDAERGAFLEMDQFLELMLDPFVDGRSGAGWPFGGTTTASSFAPGQQAGLPPDIALAYAGILKAPPPATFNQRWTTWAAGFAAGNTSNGDPTVIGSTNVTASDYGYAAGMDYHYSPDTVVGFALAGGGTNWGLADNLGGGRSDDFHAGVYGVTRSGPWYLAGALALANHWMRTNRTALGEQLTASFTAQSYGARVEGGYRYVTRVNNIPVGITPYAALRVETFDAPSYSETNPAGGFGLSYSSMNATDTRSELGARFDSPAMLGTMPLELRSRLAWAHDWVSNPSLGAVFEAVPGSNFIVYGAPFPKDSALATAGAVLHITSSWSFAAKFDGDFASGSHTYGGTATLRHTW